jgi:hypothetical protein
MIRIIERTRPMLLPTQESGSKRPPCKTIAIPLLFVCFLSYSSERALSIDLPAKRGWRSKGL